jgi:predicted unusual protein kinase regulating ubiquinone biosynthesis (AarF/ABC1/UbiB family)
MEILQISSIFLCESAKYVYSRKFDTESFWHKCIGVNIIYTKFFQAIAAKYNIHGAVHTIPYTPDEMITPTIAVSKVIGSGLISIVYEGVLNDKPVVVKTKRKNIRERVTKSLHKINTFLSYINYVYKIPTLLRTYQEVYESFYTQLDFSQEVMNHKRFQTIVPSCIEIPILYESECTEDQIVMSKLDGIPLSSLTSLQKEKTISYLAHLIVRNLTIDGFIHGDLHSGNILFQENSVGIIDFGYMIAFTKEEKNAFFEMMKHFILNDFTQASSYTMEFIHPYTIKLLLTEKEKKDIRDYIIHVYQKATSVHHCFQANDIMEMNQKLNQYNLYFSPLFYKLIVSLHAIEKVLNELSMNPSDIILYAMTSILSD